MGGCGVLGGEVGGGRSREGVARTRSAKSAVSSGTKKKKKRGQALRFLFKFESVQFEMGFFFWNAGGVAR